jgi:hypothetical protein
MYHTGQECRFVLKVADAEAFQAGNTTPTDRVCAVSTTSIGLPLEFRIISAGQTKLADIRDNYERASEDAFIAGLRTLNEFGTKNDVQRPGH